MALTDEEAEFLLDLYLLNNSQKDIVERFRKKFGYSVSRSTIYALANRKGLISNPHGGYRHGLTKDELRELHRQYKGNIDKIVKATNYKSRTILRERYRELGLVV